METINITINEINMSVPANATLKDIMDKFFRARCEFVVNINSEFIKNKDQKSVSLKNNDKLQIIAYSMHNYQPQRRTIFKEEKEKSK